MLRVIRSTVQDVDIDTEQAEDFEKAIDDALDRRDQERETFSLDDAQQPDYRIVLLPYTDPNGQHRWAVLDSGPTEVDWQDTDDLDEAIAAYEEWVRAATAGATPDYDSEGNRKPMWDESDVEGVAASVRRDGSNANNSARLVDAKWAHEELVAMEDTYRERIETRQIKFAKAADAWGRGGPAVLASRVDLKSPTVKQIVDRGRELLAEKSADSGRVGEG